MKRISKRKVSQDATPEEKSCLSKVRHPTEMDARLSAQKAVFRRHSHGEKDYCMWVYPCTFCTGWHTTSRLSGYPGRVTLNSLSDAPAPPVIRREHPAEKAAKRVDRQFAMLAARETPK